MRPPIRELRVDEREAWLELRGLLWPETSREAHAAEQDEILADPQTFGVLVAAGASGFIGFVEVAIRDWAEGCETRPVGYIEGSYVKPAHRRSGLGRRLIEAAEDWARRRGCAEMGSDAELGNTISHAAHRALGYAEIGRLVLFAKRLAPRTTG